MLSAKRSRWASRLSPRGVCALGRDQAPVRAGAGTCVRRGQASLRPVRLHRSPQRAMSPRQTNPALAGRPLRGSPSGWHRMAVLG